MTLFIEVVFYILLSYIAIIFIKKLGKILSSERLSPYKYIGALLIIFATLMAIYTTIDKKELPKEISVIFSVTSISWAISELLCYSVWQDKIKNFLIKAFKVISFGVFFGLIYYAITSKGLEAVNTSILDTIAFGLLIITIGYKKN